MTRCSCCRTTDGPFVRDRDLPGRPVCGVPRRARKRLDAGERIRDCLARRRALEDAHMAPTQPVEAVAA